MSTPREIVMLAQDLYQQLGVAGVALADARAGGRRAAGDVDGEEFWRRVSRAMIIIAVTPHSVQCVQPAGPKSERLVWLLMQRIEGCRHLADEAGAAAAAAKDDRADLEALAEGWRQLAATFEHMAGALDEVLPAQAFCGNVYELN